MFCVVSSLPVLAFQTGNLEFLQSVDLIHIVKSLF